MIGVNKFESELFTGKPSRDIMPEFFNPAKLIRVKRNLSCVNLFSEIQSKAVLGWNGRTNGFEHNINDSRIQLIWVLTMQYRK